MIPTHRHTVRTLLSLTQLGRGGIRLAGIREVVLRNILLAVLICLRMPPRIIRPVSKNLFRCILVRPREVASFADWMVICNNPSSSINKIFFGPVTEARNRENV